MSNFIISARKYRPVNFDDVIGQKVITNTLKEAIKNNKLAQALLFTGPRGVGKTSCARIVARELNNFEISDDNSYNIFELDAASNNGVEGIRNLIEQTRIPPQTGKFKVYIIDEVHMLSSGAFNAFLKTLEEPPAHCVFILATTEKHKIIPTILSRCQIYNFKRITNEGIVDHLKNICKLEKIKFEDNALIQIANKSDGAMRDALQLFDKVVGVNKELTSKLVSENLNNVDFETYIKLFEFINKNDIPNLIVEINSVLDNGISGDIFISGLSSFFRDALVCKNKLSQNLVNYDEANFKLLLDVSSKVDYNYLIEYMNILNDAEINFQKSINQKLLIELTMLKIVSLEYNEEKKKFKYKLIPTFRFQEQVFLQDSINAQEQKKKTPLANIKIENFKTSTLSLKSIQKNKEIESESEVQDDHFEEKLVTIEDVLELWDEYIQIQEDKGRYNIASILRISTPTLKENHIHYKVSNNTSALEIDLEKHQLVQFLRNRLKAKIELVLTTDKTIDKKLTYTNKDKYNLLKEKNPLIEELKNIFKLSI
ncbi:MAG: DNA polymerase III subunit gamma/tau [Candidatus Pelagibacter sp. TMED153]|nr:MAG: DNA polymerase III subunit gamma/tau [Candidatus Pelagibacter sp. TMED153]|tara:strand:- start:934 stop:2556 length:1623 start_codon:yes stop_codon:yes gene_type:complete